MKICISLTLFLLVSLPLHAHYIWLEQDGSNQAKAFFGEWHKELVEVSGGRLDNFKVEVFAPAARVSGTSRQQDHVAVELTNKGDLVWIEAMPPRKSRNADDITRTIMAARSGRTEAKALVSFDLVPQAPHSDEFVLMFEGRPVPDTEIILYNPNREETKFKTDMAGRVTLDARLPGRYIITTTTMDNKPGIINDLPYDKTRYSLTLSFVADK